MLNKPKYILFILSIAFSALTIANMVLFYYHIEDLAIFVFTTLATCTFSIVSLTYLFLHFKKNYISKKVVEDENGEIDMKKLKLEIDNAQKDKAYQIRIKKQEELIAQNKNNPEYEKFLTKLLVKELDVCQAAFFTAEKRNNLDVLKLTSSFAYHIPESQEVIFEFGEGLLGQAAMEGKPNNIKNVPNGYIQVLSGLGKATPNHLFMLPFKRDNKVTAVLELASFKEFDAETEQFLKHISEIA
jgi:putative methionine-R-sulfoxide reductase with GAF domain